jgi:DNA replication protein DnaC
MRQEERKLREIKERIRDKHKDQPNGDILTSNEFQIYLKLWQSNVPVKYWEYELSDITEDSSRHTIEKYTSKLKEVLSKGIGLYFCGRQGTGKTLAACIVLKEALRQGYTVYFTMLTEVLSRYCDGMYDKEARAAFARSILEADILVVDDIDKGYLSEKSTFIDSAYDFVFRSRANKNLPIIITSNLSRGEFTAQEGMTFGRSLLSLFDEHLHDVIVTCTDRRKEIQKKMGDFFNE